MNNWIGNIYYFGSPKDGFKVYPDPGAASNIFSGYYTNTEDEWFLIARKSEQITRYTYVRYGLLTALVEGRTGSCFGISIDFENHYFIDLRVFLTDIFEGLWGAFLDEKQLLEVQGSSGKVAFKSYDLYDVAPYLDGVSKKIGEVIRSQKYSAFVRPSYEIPQATDNQVYGLHPNSSPSAINEYFRMYGVVKLAPNLPLEMKSLAEKQEEDRENLKKKIEELNEQLKQKDREVQAANQRLAKLQGLIKPIITELNTTPSGNESHGYGYSSRPATQSHQPLTPQNHKTPQAFTHNPYQQAELDPKTKKILLIVGAVLLVALAIVATFYLLTDETSQQINTGQPSQPASQPTPTVGAPEPLLSVSQNGRTTVVLNEQAFFEVARGRTIYDEADFKDVLTTFLFRSPDVRAFYRSKDDLWEKIRDLNPMSTQKLSAYLNEKKSFQIEGSNADQKEILRNLVIFPR